MSESSPPEVPVSRRDRDADGNVDTRKEPGSTILVADIGGTHVRFGLAEGDGSVHRESTFFCADYVDVAAAATDYFAGLDSSLHPTRGVFAIACPVTGDRVEMTNHVWDFSVDEARRKIGLQDLKMVNDFTALALAVPSRRRRVCRATLQLRSRLSTSNGLAATGRRLAAPHAWDMSSL